MHRGPFLVSLNVQGFLDSRKNATLNSAVEGSTTIISIVPEGTWVTQGEVVCELDASVLREQSKQQEITSTQAEAAMASAREALEIQKTQNESDIAAARLASELAQLDLQKYRDGEFPQQKKELAGNVAIAKEELLRAKETLEFTSGQVKKGYASQNELEAARIAVAQSELKLQGAEELLNVLENYTYKRTIAELEANALESERELARVKLKAESARTQREKDVEAAKLTYDVEREKLDRLQSQIEACTLRAPQEGEVVYATMSSGSRSSQPATIEAGATVRERQPIINLPDVNQMKVSCRIHESMIGSVRKGLPARIRVDAYPEEIYQGEVAQVSSVPMSGSWPNLDLREYQTEVNLTDDPEKVRRLRPGLTSQVEILVDNRPSVLQIPVQCVVNVVDKQIVYVYTGTGDGFDRREVRLGQANQSHLEVIEGLEEGEQAVMNPRSRFAREISQLETELNAAKSEAEPTAEQTGEALPAVTPAPGGAAAGATPASKPESSPAAKPESSPAAGGGPGRGDPAAFFARMDQDKDGSLSLEELPEQMRSRFSELDKDGDGKISAQEFAAGRRRPE